MKEKGWMFKEKTNYIACPLEDEIPFQYSFCCIPVSTGNTYDESLWYQCYSCG